MVQHTTGPHIDPVGFQHRCVSLVCSPLPSPPDLVCCPELTQCNVLVQAFCALRVGLGCRSSVLIRGDGCEGVAASPNGGRGLRLPRRGAAFGMHTVSADHNQRTFCPFGALRHPGIPSESREKDEELPRSNHGPWLLVSDAVIICLSLGRGFCAHDKNSEWGGKRLWEFHDRYKAP
jgi:hypothetical protein